MRRSFAAVKEKLGIYIQQSFNYLNDLSKLQIFVAISSGIGTTYYIGMSTVPYLGNIMAFTVGTLTGGVVGTVSVYWAEKDPLFLIENLKQTLNTQIDAYENKKENLLVLIGRKQELDSNQLTYSKIIKSSLWLELAIEKQFEGKPITQQDFYDLHKCSSLPHLNISSFITGTLAPSQSEAKFPSALSIINNHSVKINISAETSHWGKLIEFIKHSSRYQRVTMLSNGSIVGYYVQYSLAIVANMPLAIASGILFGTLSGPLIVYFTAKIANDELSRLNAQTIALNTYENKLTDAVSQYRVSISQLSKVSIFNKKSQLVSLFANEVNERLKEQDLSPSQFYNIYKTLSSQIEKQLDEEKTKPASHQDHTPSLKNDIRLNFGDKLKNKLGTPRLFTSGIELSNYSTLNNEPENETSNKRCYIL